MIYATAKPPDISSIPVIDITPLRDRSDPQSVARALLEASQTLGFIYVSGHGIPDQVIETARKAGSGFFHLGEKKKQHTEYRSIIEASWRLGIQKCRTMCRST